MVKIASVEQIRTIESEANDNGYTYETMMDTAGRFAANQAIEMLKGITAPKITILVGSGNNGGDGLVTGLYLAQDLDDADVRFYLLSERSDTFVETAKSAELFIAFADHDGDKRVLRNMIASSDLVIDALFGIGVRLPIREEAQKILRNVNRAIKESREGESQSETLIPLLSSNSKQRIQVLAIDCPSGLDCDNGEIDSQAIPADVTVSFIAIKPGHLKLPGSEAVGQLIVSDIGIPKKVESLNKLNDIAVSHREIHENLPKRMVNSHKGTYGKALVIGGSMNYIGAPALATEAAYRAGAGLVTVATAGNIIQVLAGQIKEATWLLLPSDMGAIASGASNVVMKDIHRYDALLIGPGIGTEKTTHEFIKNIFAQVQEPNKAPVKRQIGFRMEKADSPAKEEASETRPLPSIVIDADALNILAEIDQWWTMMPPNTVITPHPAEMARLCKIDTKDVQSNRWELAREKASEWNVTIVLKGAYTVIASPKQGIAIIPFATDALATAGTGDVLAGVICGLLAQGSSPYQAAMCGAYVHGLAGTLAGMEKNSRSIIAGDILPYLSHAFDAINS